MDYQNRVGSKKGSGGIAGTAETNQYRRERLKTLLQSKINIDSDPYVFKNHLGVLECKLCLTTHMSESNYITHTTGRRHQLNLMRRAEIEKRQNGLTSDSNIDKNIKKRYWKSIGKPQYKAIKIRDEETSKKGLLFVLKLDKIKSDVTPAYKFVSNKEFSGGKDNDTSFQYLVISTEPYENIAFKIPNTSSIISNKTWDYWDVDTKEYCLQFFYSS